MTDVATVLPSRPADKQSAGEVVEMFRVPQITCHAFCETVEMTSVLETAIDDRRMSRAHAKIFPGGFAAALAMYTKTATPDLVLFESTATMKELFQQLDALADVCGVATKVMVIGHTNDIDLYRGVLGRGLSDYLVAPLAPMSIIAAIARIYQETGSAKLGRSLAFIGARGGVGSSTVAHNVASAMARLYSSDVILADLDLPFGSASLGFNIERAQGSLAQAIADQRLDDGLLERLLTKSGEHLNILTAPASLDGCYDLGEKVFEQVLDIARSTVPFVALDVPHIWTSWAKKTLLDADEVVITATPDLVSLRNARNLIEALRQSRPNDAPPRLVLNQVGMPKRSEVKASQFAAALHIEPIACLAFDPSTFSTAANSGRMIADVSARSAASKAFTNIAQTISARTGLTRNRRGRFALGRLWRK